MNATQEALLDWPAETAVPFDAKTGSLNVPGSNLVLDLHGDPLTAKLVVYSDGNHHMALLETLAAFVEREPDVVDVFYATTPPRVISEALAEGHISTGNVRLSLKPHVFISPGDVLDGLHADGLIGPHAPVMQSRSLSILVAKGNPKSVGSAADLLNGTARLAISNPVTEKASFSVYEAALLAVGAAEGRDEAEIGAFLRSDAVAKSQIIHHREIPQILASGLADASLIYHHLALRYCRIFPDRFDLVEMDIAALPEPERFVTAYHLGLVDGGGDYGAAFAEFYKSETAADIYRRHGLGPVENA